MSAVVASMLSCERVGVTIGGCAILSDISLSLKSGEVTAVVGPNGAGKSTLLSALAGLLAPTTGTMSLDQTPLLSMKPRDRARRIAVLPQTPEIAWPIEARALVELGRTPFLGARGQTADDRAAVDRALIAANVRDLQHRLVTTLSGGERARVLIARALAGEPEWLLADEPLTGLDPAHQLDAAALFRRLADDGAGVVVTLHDLSLALRLADRIVVLTEGHIIGDGSPETALTPDVLRSAYGVEAIVTAGPGGPLVDVIRRVDL